MLRHVMACTPRRATRDSCSPRASADSIKKLASTLPHEWNVEVVDTGLETATGERLRHCRDRVGDPFVATYADGLANVDLRALETFHNAHEGVATLRVAERPTEIPWMFCDNTRATGSAGAQSHVAGRAPRDHRLVPRRVDEPALPVRG